MRARLTLFVYLCAEMSQAGEPVKISKAQAEIFSKGATETRQLGMDAAGWFSCQPNGGGGAPKDAPVLLTKTRDIVLGVQSEFIETKPSEAQRSSSSRLFAGLLRLNRELQMSLTTPPATARCTDLRTVSLGTVYGQEVAFTTVSKQESLTFDLQVTSDPGGATVLYRRQGDTVYQQQNTRTPTIIQGLDWAVWFLRLEAPGFNSAERSFDPFRERITALYVQLDRK